MNSGFFGFLACWKACSGARSFVSHIIRLEAKSAAHSFLVPAFDFPGIVLKNLAHFLHLKQNMVVIMLIFLVGSKSVFRLIGNFLLQTPIQWRRQVRCNYQATSTRQITPVETTSIFTMKLPSPCQASAAEFMEKAIPWVPRREARTDCMPCE